MGDDSKSKKWNQAVANATGGGQAVESNAPQIPTSSALVQKFTQAEVEAIMSAGDLEFAPQLKSLEEGEMVAGYLEGNGPEAEFADKDTGEVKTVKTWIISAPDGGQRISILSSAQLDRKLPPFVGGPVKIVRGKDLKTGNGHRVTDYLVAGPKLPNGQRRSWARPPMLDVVETKALPNGANAAAHPEHSEDLIA